MNETVKQGKKKLLIIFLGWLLLSVISLLFSGIINPPQQYPQIPNNISQITNSISYIGFAFFLFLAYFTYKGHSWAKWIIVVWFVINGVLAPFEILFLSVAPVKLPTYILPFHLLTSMFLLFSGIYILKSKVIDSFLKHQRGITRTPSEGLTKQSRRLPFLKSIGKWSLIIFGSIFVVYMIFSFVMGYILFSGKKNPLTGQSTRIGDNIQASSEVPKELPIYKNGKITSIISDGKNPIISIETKDDINAVYNWYSDGLIKNNWNTDLERYARDPDWASIWFENARFTGQVTISNRNHANPSSPTETVRINIALTAK